ncbi:cytokine receptor family member B16 [Pristis pectinata]|uniref:cytokine receptor family member B16 n=1 Tax=Pristis pectinata TaxID=685728 RepID=UPI00223D55A9|nr:cytokine receptor family member B16 [Pristis pectinata]
MQTKRKEHESEWFLNVIGHVLFTSVFLVSTSGRGLEGLQKPKNVYVNSTNMRHILRWSPVRVPLGEVSYSVQFQGEFERNHRKTWVAITECSSIKETWCDVTADVSSDVDYNLKVRSELGNVTSKWETLSELFNRKETNLTAPRLTVEESGSLVTLDVSEVKKNIKARIYYWEKGVEQQVMNIFMDQSQRPYYLPVQKGVTYCFQAQICILEYNKSSSFSDIVCEAVSDDITSNSNVVTVATVLLLGVCFLVTSLFCIVKFCCWTRHVFFPKVSAPNFPNLENLQAVVLKAEDYSQESCDAVEVRYQSEALLCVHQALTAQEKINNSTDMDSWPINSVSYGNVSQSQWPMQITYQRRYQSQMNLEHAKLSHEKITLQMLAESDLR